MKGHGTHLPKPARECGLGDADLVGESVGGDRLRSRHALDHASLETIRVQHGEPSYAPLYIQQTTRHPHGGPGGLPPKAPPWQGTTPPGLLVQAATILTQGETDQNGNTQWENNVGDPGGSDSVRAAIPLFDNSGDPDGYMVVGNISTGNAFMTKLSLNGALVWTVIHGIVGSSDFFRDISATVDAAGDNDGYILTGRLSR